MNKQEAKAELIRIRKEAIESEKAYTERMDELKAILDKPESEAFILDIKGFIKIDFAKELNRGELILQRQQPFRTESEAQRADDKRIATFKYFNVF